MRAVAGMGRTTAPHARAPVGKPPVARSWDALAGETPSDAPTSARGALARGLAAVAREFSLSARAKGPFARAFSAMAREIPLLSRESALNAHANPPIARSCATKIPHRRPPAAIHAL